MSNFRVVIDTNVLISGLFSIKDSPSSQILQAVRLQQITNVTSPNILEEVADVISRKRIIKLTKMDAEEQVNFMHMLIGRSEVTKGERFISIGSRDVKDNKLLICGLEANADYIITGDEDLLTLHVFEEIKIVSPRQFIGFIT